MDGKRFDDLSRVLGTAVTRQSVLQRLAGFGVACLAALTRREAAAKKRHGHNGRGHGKKGKRKKRRARRGDGRVSAEAALCPGNQDKVCHCAPGNLGNCSVTGNGGGHSGDPLDCCCTINGVVSPACSCSGSSCCKPAGTNCSNTGQCCEGLFCCTIVNGIGTCQPEACCVPETCAADHPGVCGTFPDGCGGELTCCADDPACCAAGQACSGQTCCTPLTCADNPGGCGAFSPGCDLPDIECACDVGTCCGATCVDGSECCVAGDCPALLCQTVVDCLNGACVYTPVGNQQPGPQCDNAGQSCCNGETCCDAGQACTGDGCCTPLTCADFPGQCGALADGCGGQVNCGCGAGEGCCDGQCVAGEECCADSDCAAVLCQVADCVTGDCDYTPVPDNIQGPLCAGSGQFCCNGGACCEAHQVCTPQGCCTPQTCAGDHFGVCGPFDNGCGGQITCCADNPACCEAGLACNGQTCCTPKTCDDFPQPCGPQADGCGGLTANCQCPGGCTPLTCADFPGLCGPQDDGCGGQTAGCTCPADQTCSQGVCTGCVPQTKDEACAGSNVACGIVADGCGGQYNCGGCPTKKSCLAGVCVLAARAKRRRCQGHGLAGQPCKGKKCKCKAGRHCHHGKCCETNGDGSRHCNADSDCCPGLDCRRRDPNQHKVCVRKLADAQSVATLPEAPRIDYL